MDALTKENLLLREAGEVARKRLAETTNELAVLERTVNELTRQSTNDAFAAARKCGTPALEQARSLTRDF